MYIYNLKGENLDKTRVLRYNKVINYGVVCHLGKEEQ